MKLIMLKLLNEKQDEELQKRHRNGKTKVNHIFLAVSNYKPIIVLVKFNCLMSISSLSFKSW